MKVTLEISMCPLRSDYEEQVLKFIDYLKDNTDFQIEVNAMSTQVTGDMELVFKQVQKSIERVYENGVKASFVMKVLHGALDLDFKS